MKKKKNLQKGKFSGGVRGAKNGYSVSFNGYTGQL